MIRTGWWKARGVHAGVAAATTLALAGLGVAAMAATTAGASKVAITRDGFRCTKVSNGINHVLVGRANQVVCAAAGNDTLIAKGPGRVVLIAGTGHDTLIASSNRHSHDILIGGAATDKFKGGAGWDNMWGGGKANTFSGGTGSDQVFNGGPQQNTYNCPSSGAQTIVVKDTSAKGAQDDDCQGADDSSANLEFEGKVTATDGTTTMTISVSDANDAGQTWLTGQKNPPTVTFDITNAKIERDGGGKVQVGDDVEVAANQGAGPTLVAVSVQAGSGGDDNQGDDDNQGGNTNCQGDNSQGQQDGVFVHGSSGPSGPSGPSGACCGSNQDSQDTALIHGSSGPTGPTGATGSCGQGGDE